MLIFRIKINTKDNDVSSADLFYQGATLLEYFRTYQLKQIQMYQFQVQNIDKKHKNYN